MREGDGPDGPRGYVHISQETVGKEESTVEGRRRISITCDRYDETREGPRTRKVLSISIHTEPLEGKSYRCCSNPARKPFAFHRRIVVRGLDVWPIQAYSYLHPQQTYVRTPVLTPPPPGDLQIPVPSPRYTHIRTRGPTPSYHHRPSHNPHPTTHPLHSTDTLPAAPLKGCTSKAPIPCVVVPVPPIAPVLPTAPVPPLPNDTRTPETVTTPPLVSVCPPLTESPAESAVYVLP